MDVGLRRWEDQRTSKRGPSDKRVPRHVRTRCGRVGTTTGLSVCANGVGGGGGGLLPTCEPARTRIASQLKPPLQPINDYCCSLLISMIDNMRTQFINIIMYCSSAIISGTTVARQIVQFLSFFFFHPFSNRNRSSVACSGSVGSNEQRLERTEEARR